VDFNAEKLIGELRLIYGTCEAPSLVNEDGFINLKLS
jgi:hypothetical protein